MPTSTLSTPSSDAGKNSRWRGALGVAAGVLLLVLALIVGRVVWFDAYWIYREHPPWLEVTGGASRLMDRQTRRAKVLQALTRKYTVALLGSSTVYHGLDPRDVQARLRGRVYNAGISALMADELPMIASVVASRGGLERVIVGLDYYMFSRLEPPPVQLSRALLHDHGRWNTLLGSAMGRYAIADSFIDEVAGGDDPGLWTHDGFRITPKLPPELTQQNDATRRRITAAYRPETLAPLREALRELAGVPVTLYLSPVSDAQRRVMVERDLLDDFARWRADVARVAADHQIRFHDLADRGTAYPFDPSTGSTDVWLDNLHYTPLLGRQVLEAVGLRSLGLPE
jgi:hypothetical protein